MMTVDELRRRDLLGLTLAAATLVACGPAQPAAPVVPTRRVTDLAGRVVDIPVDPRRIVALDPNPVTADLLALDLAPIAATTTTANPVDSLGPGADGLLSLGAVGAADLEQVAALGPDLIFYATDYQEIDLDTLSAIAPVVSYPRPPSGLFASLRWLGDLLGRATPAADLEREVAALVEQNRAAIGLEGRRVAMPNLLNYDEGRAVVLLGPDFAVGQLVELLGGTVVPTEVAGLPLGEDNAMISEELVPEALGSADVVVALRYSGSAELDRFLEARIADPVWQGIPAVARGDVAYLDLDQANGNLGIIGLRAALADLAAQRR